MKWERDNTGCWSSGPYRLYFGLCGWTPWNYQCSPARLSSATITLAAAQKICEDHWKRQAGQGPACSRPDSGEGPVTGSGVGP